MTSEKTYREILKKHWGYDDFRGIQLPIIQSIGSGHDTLGLMPTGGGKSITFQVPALAADGVCVVVTPLIALMKDQVANLRRRGIRAAAIHSGMGREEMLTVLDNMVFGAVKILYVSPERLGTEIFQKKLSHARVSFVTVDEAHCISQWGYDFRPAYLQISIVRQLLPDVPVLALTATATPEVVDDIQERLGFREKRVFRMSFERKNLAYVVRHADDKVQEMLHILRSVEGCAIVYARSRQRTKEMAEALSGEGITATFFHAGLENAVKDLRQKEWQEGKVRVMVATNAFGMGIDKPDVRLVLHVDCPDSLEAYFQEAGRAGRDGQKAYAVLLYGGHDRGKLQRRVGETFPEKDYIRDVYEHLAYFFQVAVGAGFGAAFDFNADKFCHIYKFFPIPMESALQILDRAGYIEYTAEQDSAARVMFLLERDELYRLRGNTPLEDKLIEAMLRTYGGLFSDYHFVDEGLLAHLCGCTHNDVYQSLKSLDRKHIIHFIPHKAIPRIRYSQRREEARHLSFPPGIYEERKRQYEERIRAVVHYAESDDTCRSRLLLDYFGERRTNDCGQCDVCLSRHGKHPSDAEVRAAGKRIADILSDGRPHHVTEIEALGLSREVADEALRQLLASEAACQRDGLLCLVS